jgi:hypothetical protein
MSFDARPWISALVLICAVVLPGRAGDLDTIGITLLRQVDPSLNGSGIRVAQTEASINSGANDFEVNPGVVSQSASLFTWSSSLGSGSTYPNSVGSESWHANTVAANFYGITNGPATQVSHVDNYDADYFVNNIIAALVPPSIPARVVNQSFIFDPGSETAANSVYDKYAAAHGTVFSSGVGNQGTVAAPGTCYNGLGVAAYGITSAVGPTTDGRCKPDLVAPDQANWPNGANSYSIPYVSAGAAILLQAAARGDGGPGSSMATNSMVIKALLLNGALKPADWTNSITRPLDLRYGAGVLNVFNSWNELKAGRRVFIEATTNAPGAPHQPGGAAANESSLIGWDLNAITNSLGLPNYNEQVNHYYFQLTGGSAYTATATLTWNRQQTQTAINDLNLFLYNCANSNLVLCSTSAVDNVEHLFIPSLPPGRYDLQVQKNPAGQVSATENYALAFEFFNSQLSITQSNSDVVISWPVAPAGFRLVTAPTIDYPLPWLPVVGTPLLTNGSCVLSLPSPTGSAFFRLQRP